jgi:hypothetical protein
VSDNKAIAILRSEERENFLISAWVPPAWAERTKRTPQQIALQTIEAIKMQLVALNMDPDPASVILATLSCLQIGLRPDGASGHAYLLPFGGRVMLCIGYKGYVALAARSGIRQICSQVVFQGDRFETATLDNLSACRRYLPGPNASIASPKDTWHHGFAYGVWLDGTCTEPLILSGQELRDRHNAAVARNARSYAKGNAVQWARNQMIRRLLSGGQLALAADEYGGTAPAVLGAQIDAAGEAGRLREVAQATLMAGQHAVPASAVDRAASLLLGASGVSDADAEQGGAKPRTPAEQLERQRRQADEPPPMPPELHGWAEGEEP